MIGVLPLISGEKKQRKAKIRKEGEVVKFSVSWSPWFLDANSLDMIVGASVFCSQLLFLKIDLASLLPGPASAKLGWLPEAEVQLPSHHMGTFCISLASHISTN